MDNALSPNATLTGIPAIRPSALSKREQRALSEALSEWRVRLVGVVSPNQYQQIVCRHVAIVSDPGSVL